MQIRRGRQILLRRHRTVKTAVYWVIAGAFELGILTLLALHIHLNTGIPSPVEVISISSSALMRAAPQPPPLAAPTPANATPSTEKSARVPTASAATPEATHIDQAASAGATSPREPIQLNEKEPTRLSGRAATYPPTALDRGIEGKASIQVWVDPQGQVTKAIPTDARDLWGFSSAALHAAKTWRFQPFMRDGEAVPFVFIATFRFELAN